MTDAQRIINALTREAGLLDPQVDHALVDSMVDAIEFIENNRAPKQPKLIVLTGEPATGKTTFAREWVAEDPERRRRADSALFAREYLARGFDVILDPDGGNRLGLIAQELYGLPFEVRWFEYDETKVWKRA